MFLISTIWSSFFKTKSKNLCIFTGVIRSFTFNVVNDVLIFKSVISLLVSIVLSLCCSLSFLFIIPFYFFYFLISHNHLFC